MSRIKSGVLGAAAAAALVLAGLGSPASAATAERDIRAPQLTIKHVGDPEQYGGASLTLSIRCFGGALAKELDVKITQGQVSGGRSEERDDIVCDGVRRDVADYPYSDDGQDFVAGPAMVTARLTVVDPKTMKPLPQVEATQRVYLRPYVTVTIAKGPVRINANGRLVVRASIKCRDLYQVSSFYVSASQNDGRIYGSAGLHGENPPCDGTLQERTFTITPNKPFTPGKVRLTAVGGLLDAGTYDPVDVASVVRSRRAVRSCY